MSDASPETPPEAPPPRPPRKRSQAPLGKYFLLLVVGLTLVTFGDVWGFFLFLMVMGAALSYLGDQLGSYCGRQRLSLFGLRPRDTAGLINGLTGLTITAMTLFGASYVSENVHIALTSVDDLRQQAKRLGEARDGLTQDVEDLRGQLAGRLAQAEALSAEKDELLEEKARLESTNSLLGARFEALDQANQAFEAQNRELEASLQDLRERRESLDASIQEKLVEIDRLNLALEKKETAPVVILRGQVLLEKSVSVPFGLAPDRLQALVTEVVDQMRTSVQLLDVRFGDEAAQHLITRGVEVVSRRLRELDEFYRTAAAEGKIRDDEVPRECRLLPVSARNVSVGEALRRVTLEVKPNLRIFPAGAEIARTVVDGSLEPGRILDQMLYFNDQVRSVLREKGVSASALQRRNLVSDPSRLLRLVRIVDQVQTAGEPVVVRCVVEEDLFAFGEPRLGLVAELPTPVPPPESKPEIAPAPVLEAPGGSSAGRDAVEAVAPGALASATSSATEAVGRDAATGSSDPGEDPLVTDLDAALGGFPGLPTVRPPGPGADLDRRGPGTVAGRPVRGKSGATWGRPEAGILDIEPPVPTEPDDMALALPEPTLSAETLLETGKPLRLIPGLAPEAGDSGVDGPASR